jgi:hypothetical protein
MRQLLRSENGIRKKFTATFSKIGKKVNFKGHSEDTILLTNVKDIESGMLMTDHIWFTYSITFQRANLSPGMAIEFEARIKEYQKGYVNRALGKNKKRTDYKLSHPTKVSVIKP